MFLIKDIQTAPEALTQRDVVGLFFFGTVIPASAALPNKQPSTLKTILLISENQHWANDKSLRID